MKTIICLILLVFYVEAEFQVRSEEYVKGGRDLIKQVIPIFTKHSSAYKISGNRTVEIVKNANQKEGSF